MSLLALLMILGLLIVAGPGSPSQEVQEAPVKRAKLLFQEGRRLYYQGRFAAAREKFHQAHLLEGDADVLSLKYEGLCYQYLDELDQALALFEKALRIHERYVDDPRQLIGLADALNNVGWVLYLKGDYVRAVDYLQRAKRAIEIPSDEEQGVEWPPWLRGTILTNLGVVYAALGNYSMAFTYLRWVAEQSPHFNDPMNETRTYRHLGNLERLWGNRAAALRWYEKAVVVGRTAYRYPYNRAYLAEVLNDLGMLYGQQQMVERAQAVLGEALALSRRLGVRRLIARSLLNLGNLARDAGEMAVAVARHREALAVSEEARLRPLMALALAELGWDELERGEVKVARGYFLSALAVGGETLSADVQARIYAGLAEAEEARGDEGEAARYYQRAIDQIDRVHLEVLSEERKMGFWRQQQEIFARAIALLYRRQEKAPGAGHGRRAFAYAERARARALLDTLVEGRIRIRRGLGPEVIAEERALFGELARIGRRLLREALSEGERRRLERALLETERRLSEFRQRLRLKYPAYAALHYPEPYDVERVQREVLDARTLLIEYRLGEERSFLWAVSKTECRMVALPGREEIARWVKRCRQAITAPPSSADAFDRYVYRAHRLYRLLLAPVGRMVARYDRLIIVPDGILHYLPFEVLLTRRVTPETVHLPILLAHHRISYAPSASVLGLMQRERRRADRQKAFIAYADPVLTIASRQPGTSDDATRSVERHRRSRFPHELTSLDGELVDITRHRYGERGMSLEPLPYTRVEVNSIARLFPRKATRIYLGRAATESAVKRETLHARCVHFATHGFIDERIPARSGLIFSLIGERNEDGVLQMNEVFNLDLDADLVVLSACQSGLGTLVKGEGLIGLTRAFLYAGARSLVVSLWSVRDASTADLMKRFYQYLRAGHSRAEALRRAKLAMMNSDIPAYRFPYFWAPFILIDCPASEGGRSLP